MEPNLEKVINLRIKRTMENLEKNAKVKYFVTEPAKAAAPAGK